MERSLYDDSKSSILKKHQILVNYQPNSKYSYPSRFLSCAPPIHKSEPTMSKWKFNLKQFNFKPIINTVNIWIILFCFIAENLTE